MERMTSGLIRRLGKSPCVAEVESGLPEQQKKQNRWSDEIWATFHRPHHSGVGRSEGRGGQLLNNRVMIKRHGSREGVRGDHDVTVSIGD